MINACVIKATSHPKHPYSVLCHVDADCKYTMAFFVGNPEAMPYYLRKQADNNEPVAGVFEYDEQDQFATYIPIEKVRVRKSDEAWKLT
jgi:hypothetical protein